MELLRTLWHDEDGQDLAEYGIALAVIAAGVATIVVGLQEEVAQLWGTASKGIRQVAASG